MHPETVHDISLTHLRQHMPCDLGHRPLFVRFVFRKNVDQDTQNIVHQSIGAIHFRSHHGRNGAEHV